MREACYCGRTGEIEDRVPVTTSDDVRALACPACGREDRLEWLPEEARVRLIEEAERKREMITAA